MDVSEEPPRTEARAFKDATTLFVSPKARVSKTQPKIINVPPAPSSKNGQPLIDASQHASTSSLLAAKSKGVEELQEEQEDQFADLDEKISKTLEILGGNCRNVDLDSLIEVGKELVELAVATKEKSRAVEAGYDSEGLENIVVEEGEANLELLSPQSGKKRKMFEDLLAAKTRLGIHRRDLLKLTPDCGEQKKRGRIPNQEKRKLDGDASGQQKIDLMIKVGKGGALPE